MKTKKKKQTKQKWWKDNFRLQKYAIQGKNKTTKQNRKSNSKNLQQNTTTPLNLIDQQNKK